MADDPSLIDGRLLSGVSVDPEIPCAICSDFDNYLYLIETGNLVL